MFPLRRLSAIALLVWPIGAAHSFAQTPRLVELTQTACQFLEPEKGVDHGFQSGSKADCERINRNTAARRLNGAAEMRLPPGKYVFRVRNADVPYELGFWLRGEGVSRLLLPSVSGGGLLEGRTNDYEIELAPGEYLFSCPLNSTPDYRLVVDEPS